MSLLYEKKNRIAYLTLNRPEAHNSITPEMVLEMIEAWKDFQNDNEMRCAILTGKGDQAFCAGADLQKLIPLVTGARKPETDADRKLQENPLLLGDALLRSATLYKPLIAAVNGHAIAGGMEVLYSADIRVASENATFGLQEVKWAIFPMMGSTVKLPRQVPYAKAMELLLTGELMDAQEAYRIGFVNKVVPAAKVMEEAERYANIIVKNGPMAVSKVKESVLNTIGRPLEEGLAKEVEYALPVFMSRDVKEGPRAFKEKREPQYTGK